MFWHDLIADVNRYLLFHELQQGLIIVRYTGTNYCKVYSLPGVKLLGNFFARMALWSITSCGYFLALLVRTILLSSYL